MNAHAQYLQQQNKRLAAQVHFLIDVIDRMNAEHELLGSVACGFAWDMAVDDDETIYLWDYSAKRAEESV